LARTGCPCHSKSSIIVTLIEAKSQERNDAKPQAVEMTFDERNVVEKSRMCSARAALSYIKEITTL